MLPWGNNCLKWKYSIKLHGNSKIKVIYENIMVGSLAKKNSWIFYNYIPQLYQVKIILFVNSGTNFQGIFYENISFSA